MFDLCSEKLLDNEERFAARNGHRFVEIWDCGDTRHPMYRTSDLKEKEIASWVNEERAASGPVRSGLRVLLSPKPSGKPSSGKLPFSRSTYHSLSQSWRIPSTFLRAITQKLSIVTQCSVAPILTSPSRCPPASPTTPSPNSPKCSPTSPYAPENQINEDRPSKISDSARCLLVRGDVDWTWDYTLLLTHDPSTSTTYVLIVGLTATEIDLVVAYLAQLSYSPTPLNINTHPLLVPMILLDLAADETSSLLKLRIKLLAQIQQRTGMDRFNSLKSATIAGKSRNSVDKTGDRMELDLDAVMLRLTCLSDWVAAQRGFIGLQERVVNVVADQLAEGNENDGIGPVARAFSERMDFVRETLFAAEQKCQYLERSICAQVQTIYSLIAQKDNRLNHSATRASCQIASDSRRIAILTRRDSTDMRIIAAVTLVFLPGTFVATVFSTGLFDWGNGDPTPSSSDDGGGGGGRLISRYIWVYFMLTGALTAVVLVGWICFSWVQKRKMVRFGLDLEADGEEFGMGIFGSSHGGGGGNGDDNNGCSGKRRETESTLVEEVKGPDRVWQRWKRWRGLGRSSGQDEVVALKEEGKSV